MSHWPKPILQLPFVLAALLLMPVAGAQQASREFYELRTYRIADAEKQALVSDYLQQALVPALHRQGLEPIGVFSVKEPKDDFSLIVLIPFANLDVFAQLKDQLASDAEYEKAARSFSERPLTDPAFVSIESRILRAFSGMPQIEIPVLSKEKRPRIFELRMYQSHTEDHAARKIEMFDQGEIQLMRDVQLGPVFYGQSIAGTDLPNLVYLLSAENPEQHQAHFKTFVADPRWEKMKGIERYKDTVSRIQTWILSPLSFSDL